MTATGALLEAPLSIRLLQDLFYLLLILALTGSLYYLKVNILILLGVGLSLLAFRIGQRCVEHRANAKAVPIFTCTPDAFLMAPDSEQSASLMVLQSVIRHWSGFTLDLVTQDSSVPKQKKTITIWRAHWSEHDYRRLSLLINWQLRVHA